MKHSNLIGRLLCKLVNNIKSKIEFIVILELYAVENAVFVKRCFDEFFINGIMEIGKVNISDARSFNFLNIIAHLLRAVGRNNDCVELAFLAADRNFIMRNGGIKINAVALIESFGSVADYHFQRTSCDDVDLLTVMANAMIRRIESLLRIGNYNSEGLGNLILEERSKAVINKALSPCNRHPLTLSRERIFGKARAAALHNIGNLNAADLSKLINESEAEIFAARFIIAIFFFAHADFCCHFGLSQAHIETKGNNSTGNLQNFVFNGILTKSYHFSAPFFALSNKKVSKQDSCFETSNFNPRYHSNCA